MEVVAANAFDEVCAELDAALAEIARFKFSTSYGYVRGRGKPKPEERRVEIKTRLAPLDVDQTSHPL